MEKIKIGIVGCGAVTTRSHLPVFSSIEGFEVVALADPQTDRTREVASRYEIPEAVADYREILDSVDAVVLALPHHLHGSVGEEVLLAGKHVLMEKPLANTVAECDGLIAAANKSGKTLAVAQVRRYMTAYRAAKQWLETDLLGELTSFEAEEGGTYNWPVASDFFFRPEMSGGGVLMDTGAHVLDALHWWMGDMEVLNYYDDNERGVEADCSLQLCTPAGREGTVTMSRIRTLDNRILVRGTKADLEIGLLSNQIRLIPRRQGIALAGKFIESGVATRLTRIKVHWTCFAIRLENG
jgi:predicted dehydrogenase